jgi:hypothetical protein
LVVQGLPSSHVPPLIGVPVHVPSEHMSGLVHLLPSSQLCARSAVGPHTIASMPAMINPPSEILIVCLSTLM